MSEPRLRLLGLRGFLQGEERLLKPGESVVIGRSREADFSVRRSRKFQEREDRAELLSSEPFRSVSRSHVRISFLHPDLIEVTDLSQNGTFLDGKRIDKVGITDLKRSPHVLGLGSVERVLIEWAAL